MKDLPDVSGYAELWKRRYGSEPAQQFPQLEGFLNHRSVRSFDPQPVSEDLVDGLKSAAQSASTSSNLQLWSAIRVVEPRLRKRLRELCFNYSYVETAPVFFAFCADFYRLRRISEQRGSVAVRLEFIEFTLMAAIDAALAAERMVCAAESISLGICYIGALRDNPREVAELLELPNGVVGLFGLCLGYPSSPIRAEDVKPRLSQDAVFHTDRYQWDDSAIEEYDRRWKAYLNEKGRASEELWSERTAKRVNGSDKSMNGREVWLDFLRANGVAVR